MSQPAPIWSQQLNQPSKAVGAGKAFLQQLHQQQWLDFTQGAPIQNLLSERTQHIDKLLRYLWKQHFPQDNHLCLIAVGGYGRNELFPFSDIDLLVLYGDQPLNDATTQQLAHFFTFLWDIGLQLGHAVRNLQQAYQLGLSDITIATNYTEARWLSGHYHYFDALRQLWRKRQFWPSQAYFIAKEQEQIERHNKALDALAQLEPNIKESPGGLRDIHTLVWVTRRHFNCNNLRQLVDIGFLSDREYIELETAMHFLWRVRFMLHHLNQRKEERLLFNDQQHIAQQLGYQQQDGKLAVECFMQDYYRHATHIQRLNQLLRQAFREEIFTDTQATTQWLNQDFSLHNQQLQLRNTQLFVHQPLALIDVFIGLTDNRVQGLSVQTQRYVRDYLHLINDELRQTAALWSNFRQLLRQPNKVYRTLRSMHLLGVLGRLIPAWQGISGLMQFDLFHAYTVDEHSLIVVRFLRIFLHNTAEALTHYPLACQLAKTVTQIDILLLAGLLHDIGKGKGGDHSLIGAQIANDFAQQAFFSEADQQLLVWLVSAHLLMSQTAQKKDINDPQVVAKFCQQVNSITRLNYLYLLTVADISATSPIVWNAWKDSLLQTLYHNSLAYLQQQPVQAPSRASTQLLAQLSVTQQQQLQAFWDAFATSRYWQQQTPASLNRHARLWLAESHTLPKVELSQTSSAEVLNLLVICTEQPQVWLTLTMACGLAKLNIVSAKLYRSQDHLLLIELKLLLKQKWSASAQLNWLQQLKQHLNEQSLPPVAHYAKRSRRQQAFKVATHIHIQTQGADSELTLVTRDKPGLLYHCALAFQQRQIQLISAHITTVGIQAEDVFLIRNAQQCPLDADEAQKLIDVLTQQIG